MAEQGRRGARLLASASEFVERATRRFGRRGRPDDPDALAAVLGDSRTG